MDRIKFWLYSRTVILALIQGTLGVVVAEMTIHPEVGKLMVMKSILDIVLRFATETPISF